MGTLGRSFATGNTGYHNATLGTTGVAVRFPTGATVAQINVNAGCYLGVRGTATLSTFNDQNYGSTHSSAHVTIMRSDLGGGTQDYIHIAPWTGTADVAILFG